MDEKFVLIFCLVFSWILASGQNVGGTITSSEDTMVYKNADTIPKFPGGQHSLAKFIVNNYKYPFRAEGMGLVSDRVSVSFIVTKHGKTRDVRVVQGSEKAPSLDNELVKVLQTMPDWKPAIRNGVPVDFIYFILVFPSIDRQEGVQEISVIDVTQINHLKAQTDKKYNLGVDKSQHGDLTGAIECFSQVLAANPEDIDALYNRGIMYIKSNNLDAACKDFKAIQDLGQTDADALIKKYCIK